ncbi:hypothetical protein F5B18DRAFT_581492 [Nemania serpens]|nr:hypothetical protein F5B18DRAFT_581492 [Nemania serpens]
MNHFANACGVHYERFSRLHNWLGAVVTVEAILHTVLAVNQGDYDGPANHVVEILALSSIGAIAVLSLPAIRRRIFEVFSSLHTLLATTALVAIWLHLAPSSFLPFQRGSRLYLLLCSVVFASTKVGRLLNVIYFSISFATGSSMATVRQPEGGVEIRIRMARPLKFKAGQYIYLSLWRLSTLSIFESHPFQICWAYRDENDQQVIVLLVQPQRGFTRRLSRMSTRRYRAFIEGPYGKSLPLGEYGTVLLLATGVSIAKQLPYVKKLLELYQDCQAKTRRIALFWELDEDVHRYWVNDWMDELPALDKDYLYIPGRLLSQKPPESTVKKLGTHGRITLTYAAMYADKLIASEISQRRGMTLISLCANMETTRAVIKVVQNIGDPTIQTEILDFRP